MIIRAFNRRYIGHSSQKIQVEARRWMLVTDFKVHSVGHVTFQLQQLLLQVRGDVDLGDPGASHPGSECGELLESSPRMIGGELQLGWLARQVVSQSLLGQLGPGQVLCGDAENDNGDCVVDGGMRWLYLPFGLIIGFIRWLDIATHDTDNKVN